MLFTYYDERLAEMPFLCVDGVVPNGLSLSHWPGNRTPAPLRADTSTGMALKLAAWPERDAWLQGVSIVTNNHFDTDGLLAVYAVLDPAGALEHAEALVRAARAGDFGEFRNHDAFRLDCVVTAFDDDERSPIASDIRGRPEHERYQILYDRLLGMLPGLLYDTGRFKTLWAEPLGDILRSMMRIGSTARVREHDAARLTVIEATAPLHETARFNVARHDRILTATRSEAGWLYEMAYRLFSWFDTVTPPRGSRIDLAGVAEAFNAREPGNEGRWRYDGNNRLEPRLYRAGPGDAPIPSALPLETVEKELLDLFADRP